MANLVRGSEYLILNMNIKSHLTHVILREQSTPTLTSTSRSTKQTKEQRGKQTTIEQSKEPTTQQANNPTSQQANKPKSQQATRLFLFLHLLHWSFQFQCWCHHVFCRETFVCSSIAIAATINNIITTKAKITTTTVMTARG